MQTHFTIAQLADPDIGAANDILRSCVHCGFCTATCPTYVLLGDENDGPRGRIYMIKEMLEAGFEFIDYSDMHAIAADSLIYDTTHESIKTNSDRFTLKFRKPD